MSESQRYYELTNEQLRSIHARCEAFEQSLLDDESVRIEDEILAAAKEIREPLFRELLAIELEVRVDRDSKPGIDEYRARFPGRDKDIQQAFEEISNGHKRANPKLSAPADALPEQPARVGRYRIEKVLGRGGFGLVYRARDEHLDRAVAIKVPHDNVVSRPEDAEAYLTEARTVANLDHPNIVPVHDVGSSDEFPCYVVSKYIKGTSLSAMLQENRPNFRSAAKLVATVAEALHYAHRQGLVHRDVKPGNILVGKDGSPYLLDFGLALREENIGKGPQYAGTPAYMSPEQARGEGHRVDGRSDIFSLGVVFYELLVGRQPFRGDTQEELLERVSTYEPRPIRQYDERIPRELERICQKALAKRARHRYSSAHDMAADLQQFLSEAARGEPGSDIPENEPDAVTAQSSSASLSSSSPLPQGAGSDSDPIRIIPKGLRSFDEEDAEFFVELLPGPRDGMGLPDSLRFWKTRIERTDADKTFPVGLIFGPSGCGKSSLVKAGLLPMLSEHVIPIYVEATARDTEGRLLDGLNKCCRQLPPDLDLTQTMAAIRQGQHVPTGQKVLIVIDQFEQWLHAKRDESDTELLKVLRQCDGGRVQCIVLVRDDFWLAVTRFMHELEVDLIPGRNIALADLFDRDHARKVLGAFGRAYGRLPQISSEQTNEQRAFLKQAIDSLAEDGKVVCVRLALFAEMMKGKDWTPDSLKQAGGAMGVGVTFLEETFGAPSANPTHRMHQRATRAVLRALLPETGIDIKGQLRSYAELLQISGYAGRPKDFDELIRILDSEVRLITPSEEETRNERQGTSAPGEADRVEGGSPPSTTRYYQLTHDYLVHSLRDWLTRKQKETRRGRADLRLSERVTFWSHRSENRHLPSAWEWVRIRALTKKDNWTQAQHLMMKKARRVHGTRWSVGFGVLLVLAIVIQQFVGAVRHRNLVERLQTAVETMANSQGIIVPRAIEDLEGYPRAMVVEELQLRIPRASDNQRRALAYALAHFQTADVPFLVDEISRAPAVEVDNLAAALGMSRDGSLVALRGASAACDSEEDWRLKQRLAVVALHLGDTSLALEMCRLRPDRIERLNFIREWSAWHGDVARLARFANRMRDPTLCAGICLGMGHVPQEQVGSEAKQAWNAILSEWFQNDPHPLVHSAAGWLLRQWQMEFPRIAAAREPADGLGWHVNSARMTMLKIPAGSFSRRFTAQSETVFAARFLDAPLQTIVFSNSFLMSDREVSVGQYRRMIDDPEYPEADKPSGPWGVQRRPLQLGDPVYSPTSNHPVQWVNWNDAVQFCNWLSRSEGLAPCYERTGKVWKIPTGEFEEWTLVAGTNGYRLPSEAEWEYTCRAGVEVQDPSSEVRSLLLTLYGTGLRSEANRTEEKMLICGTRPPNAWGLFDLHGNAREWCQDWYSHFHDGEQTVSDPFGPEQNDGRLRRLLRQGIFQRAGLPLSVGQQNLGFRVVRMMER